MATKKKPTLKTIRTYRSGVWLGAVVLDRVGDLGDAGITITGRRAWSWTGALDCSSLAVNGPSSGKISDETTVELRRDDIVEIHDMTDAAVERLAAVKVTK